ncbi:putative capsule-associated protein CAP1 [Aspergillus ellipticus CBS 707.79]|uniref:glycogenin glucosyltransferase n=1 Tax=Aspergillus ellipticus CBS 707.79 TaxID=1448320 RepID=A0A319DCV6_9EURO|nr:putative capsule-associated protein CAP1 [Aspergillus ellipticus CBS 707.79]
MRTQRFVVWLGTFVLVSLFLVFIRSSDTPSTLNFPPVPDPLSSHVFQRLEIPPNAQLIEQSTFRKVAQPENAHPIASLVQDAKQQHDRILSSQSKTLTQAVNEYRSRYKLHPPPHFDKWFQFTKSRGVQLIDEYDSIYHSLLPFWALEPKTIRERARETLGFDNSMIGVLIRNGTVSLAEGGAYEQYWQRSATVKMIKSFSEHLPDMDLVFNALDEPRVIVPSEDLQRLVAIAKDRAIPKAFANDLPRNSWSGRPTDLNKGDRIDEVRTTRFNRFIPQSTWSYSRSSCPVDSPVRSLDEQTADNIDSYARGEMEFVYNTTAFSDICNSPSLRYTYGFFDRPNTFEVVHDLFPVFSQSKISSYQDILYPSPWYWDNQVPYEEEKDLEWDAKIDKMYWRGSTTGGYSRAGGWRRQHRQIFLRNVNALNTAKPRGVGRNAFADLFDVRFTYIGQCDEVDCAAQREYFEVAEPADQQDAWAYKHLLDIDGNAFSGRFYAFLRSKSLIYKISIFREWHDEWIKPWTHYVPLSLTGDDYLEAMRYFVLEDEARNQLWDLSKGWSGFVHHILTLRNGFKFHYVCNDSQSQEAADQSKSVVVFLHGFPDSWAVWRDVLSSNSLQESATLVAVDLPGYGGSDSLEKYSATNVLESLTEFIIAIRTKYGVDSEDGTHQKKLIVVAHDWGCVLAMRLAAEAPQLADRFIMTNGPLTQLAVSNARRLVSSSLKMFKISLRSPIQSRSTLCKAAKTLSPLVRQLQRSKYIFAMQLPMVLVRYLGRGGNQSFLKLIHRGSYAKREFTSQAAAHCMASSMGPSIEECKTQTPDGDEYPASLKNERAPSGFQHMACYYRDGTSIARWHKSVESITALHSIASGRGIRRASSGTGLFDEGPKGSLKASATILWGKADIALEPQICLDGISDYLVSDSQLIELPLSGHFTPLEPESQVALQQAVEWAAKGEKGDIGAVVKACYPKAVTVYDELIPVNPLTNITPANLWLMDRPDLIATFTKIELWRQTQFKRIVYIDCDVLALRASDELLELEADFAAVPDVGWPDCFNSGVMVLRPNLQDYFALKALAERGISFDGADQGLLNIHFRDWHRLSFAYNCTPSANYQYVPAYKHFQSTINMIHFIGAQKPWNMARQVEPFQSPYNQLLGHWWAVYDRHYRPVVTMPIQPSETVPAVQIVTTRQEVPWTSPEDVPELPHTEFQELGSYGQAQVSGTHFEAPSQAYLQQELASSQPAVSTPSHAGYHVTREASHGYQGPQGHQEDQGYQYQGHHEHHENNIHHVQQGHPVYQAHQVDAFPQHNVPSQAHWVPTEAGPFYQHIQNPEHHAGESVPAPIRSAVPKYVRGEEHIAAYIHPQSGATSFATHIEPPSHVQEVHIPNVPTTPSKPSDVQPQFYEQPAEPNHESETQTPVPASPKREVETSFEPPKAEWDASKEPPPLNSKPEGIALETKTYTMSQDEQLFQPPPSYPEAPKNMYYDVPSTKPEPEKLTQVFPWESHAPRPTRIFAEDDQSSSTFTLPKSFVETTEEESGFSPESQRTSWTSEEPPESWENYTRSNAWDEVPEIQRYIQSLQQARKGRVQVISGGSTSQASSLDRYNFDFASTARVTDFPTEQERPSLPVTPAPIRRKPLAPGEDFSDDDLLPPAHGVPNQEDWVGITVDNPTVGLEELRRRQSEVLENPDLLLERISKCSSATTTPSASGRPQKDS